MVTITGPVTAVDPIDIDGGRQVRAGNRRPPQGPRFAALGYSIENLKQIKPLPSLQINYPQPYEQFLWTSAGTPRRPRRSATVATARTSG